MKKRFGAMLLVLCMVLSLVPMTALAADGASLTITPAEGTEPVSAEAGVYLLSSGSYTVSGTASDTESIVIQGDATLTLNSAVLKHTTTDKTKYAPAISIKSGDVNLVLQGTNEVEGSAGYAGIYVAEGASLTISGEGSLTAKGGDGSNLIRKRSTSDFADFGFDDSVTSVYFGGGAGIGGNGAWMSGQDIWLNNYETNFGTVTVDNGTVNVTGGKTNSANVGGGAGLGAGGASTKATDDDLTFSGTININGGIINALGGEGDSDNTLSGGGTGVGTGGATGGWYTAVNKVNVLIAGGEVTATGKGDGAGIGGGANVDSGIIKITNGTVNATGGYEIDDGKQDGGYGGAGIGGGDSGSATSIEITGGTVTAQAIGGGAGIGSGNCGENGGGDIVISGEAVVTAIGGSYKDRVCDGAPGIGSGRSDQYGYTNSGFDKVAILDNAKVYAFAGAKAQAIGVGTYYKLTEDFDTKVEFAKTATVWMFNKDNAQDAFWGQNDDNTAVDEDVTTNGANLVWYTGESTPEAGETANDLSNSESLKWYRTADNKVQIKDGDKVVAEASYPDGFTLGNWAAVYPTQQVTLTYQVDGTDYQTATVDAGGAVDVINAPVKENQVFTGWTDGENTYYVGEKITISQNTTLTAQYKTVSDWKDDNQDENNKDNVNIDVDVNFEVAVDVNVSVSAGIAADITDESEKALQTTAENLVTTVLNGDGAVGFDDEDEQNLRDLVNSGAEKVDITLTVGAKLTDVPSAEEKEKLADKLANGEDVQMWQLTVTMGAVASTNGTQVDKVTAFEIHQTTDPITFTLTTKQDLTNKNVSVYYIHNNVVNSASSSVTDAKNGIVTVSAKEFSPYAILSKTRHSSSSSSGTTTYPVAVADKAPAGGTVRVDRTSAAKGATVTVTATAEKGYAVGSVTVTGKDGKAVAVTAKDGKYTFVMPAQGVTVAAVFKADAAPSGDWDLGYRACPKDSSCPIAPFADAQATVWYHDGVHFCLENGLMVGTGTGIFQPGASTSRAMLSVMLWRLNGSPVVNYAMPFTDVAENSWYGEAVRWAASRGIVTGYDAQTFGPNNNVTREQMVTILYRYAQSKGYDVRVGENTNLFSYADAASVSAYATPAMQWACGSGLVQGTDNRLDPQGSTTRAQMATMMMRFCAEITK